MKDENSRKILVDAIEIHGILSVPFIMRKLKCSSEKAKEIMNEFSKKTDEG